jgi:hypothetical protein
MSGINGKRGSKGAGKARVSKRARNDTARTAPNCRVSELEEEWENLLRQSNNTLLNRLAEGNWELELTFQQYQAKMESIALCSKECLESSQNVRIDNRIRGSWGSSEEDTHISAQDNGQSTAGQATESEILPQIDPPPLLLSPSFMFQAAKIEGQQLNPDEELSANRFCELIMAGKVRTGSKWDFTLVLEHFQCEGWTPLLKEGMRSSALVNRSLPILISPLPCRCDR